MTNNQRNVDHKALKRLQFCRPRSHSVAYPAFREPLVGDGLLRLIALVLESVSSLSHRHTMQIKLYQKDASIHILGDYGMRSSS